MDESGEIYFRKHYYCKIVSLFEASNYPISVYLIIIKWTHEECEIEIRYFIYRFISVIDKID